MKPLKPCYGGITLKDFEISEKCRTQYVIYNMLSIVCIATRDWKLNCQQSTEASQWVKLARKRPFKMQQSSFLQFFRNVHSSFSFTVMFPSPTTYISFSHSQWRPDTETSTYTVQMCNDNGNSAILRNGTQSREHS